MSSGSIKKPASNKPSPEFLAGPAQAKKSGAQPVKPKPKPQQKAKIDNGPCPHAKTLRLMPPLAHWPKWSSDFGPSNSEPVRFIIHALGLDPNSQPSWPTAHKVFHKARKKKIIRFDRQTGKWHGQNYKAGAVPFHISQMALMARYRWRYDPVALARNTNRLKSKGVASDSTNPSPHLT